MIYNFPYLKDNSFLKRFNETHLKEQYVKIIVLTYDEKPIKQIQGLVTGGNISLDGSSGMRRTCNLNMIVNQENMSLTDTQNLLSINKKIEVLIGFINNTNEYSDYPMIWFPQGVYVIISPNITNGLSGLNITLTLHDKMALLNGECGGTLPASVIFSQVEDIDENGEVVINKPTIFQIILELVNHFGGQQLGKIIINDVDTRIKAVMKWTGSSPLYIETLINNTSGQKIYNVSTSELENSRVYTYGQDVGFILTDFTYPGDLIGNAGDTVVTILDQIKNTLGNYEYFYDINGNFVFQEIKNYLNNSYSTKQLLDLTMNDYLVDYTTGKSVYTFENSNIVQSYSNTPQYQQIKNDFVIWGKRKTVNDLEIPIRYHLAIDTKPSFGNEYTIFYYTDPDDGILKAKKPLVFDSKQNFPQTGEANQYYCSSKDQTGTIFSWDPDQEKYIPTSHKQTSITTNDYRTELYFAGIENEPFGLASNYYFTELKNQWPKLFDLQKNQFKEEIIESPDNIDFFLDILDGNISVAKYGVQNIGRRTTTIVDDSINCIFQPEVEDVVFIERDSDDKATMKKLKQQCDQRKQNYVQVDSNIYSMLVNGGVLRSAYEEIRRELYQYTQYNEQISLTTLPIYNLEPNTRITVRDVESDIYGDYMIKSLSIPLDINGTMSISATRALERI